ncbi:MAG: hypothetical protein Q4C47_06140, partial [Planctomycetia bacterium]|nr:hypothetical protein [Planctomycetia bacterium]
MSFPHDLRNFQKKAEAKATARLRRLALKAAEQLILPTPVDTGCARGNWRVSFGEPERVYDPGLRDRNGSATLGSATMRIANAKLGVDIYIGNS